MARPEPLDPQALAIEMRDLPRWRTMDGALVRATRAGSFSEAIDWVVRVAAVADDMRHHPDIDIRYRTVTWHLRTHEIVPNPLTPVIDHAVTERDIALAHAIDAVVDAAVSGGTHPEGRR